MIRDRNERGSRPIEIDLRGPEGNAFHLLALAAQLSRARGDSKSKQEQILDEMRLSDYEGLLWTFDREFGALVTLWR